MTLRVAFAGRTVDRGEQALERTEGTVVTSNWNIVQGWREGDLFHCGRQCVVGFKAHVQDWTGETKASGQRQCDRATVGSFWANFDNFVVRYFMVSVAITEFFKLIRRGVKRDNRSVVNMTARVVNTNQWRVILVAYSAWFKLGWWEWRGLSARFKYQFWTEINCATVKGHGCIFFDVTVPHGVANVGIGQLAREV